MIKGFYINLSNSKNRDAAIRHCLEDPGIEIEIHRYDGIYGSDAHIKNPLLSDGQWGCYLSHLSLIQNNLETNNHLLIMEDDSHFDMSINLSKKINTIDENGWDILYLDATLVEIEDQLMLGRELYKIINMDNSKKVEITRVPPTITLYGTHCYIINKKSTHKIHQLLLNNSFAGLPIDNIYCAAIKEGHLKAYITLPFLTSPANTTSLSTINSSDHPLLSSWVELRHAMSIYKRDSNYLQEKLISCIDARSKYHVMEKFNPYGGKIIKLNFNSEAR